ncbi:alpha-E domain-containing protein [Chondromyces crocatus]|uniref:DUF403 domain-containing protein n=1 Tax=Chondromyces crocatus TaxID=52 RepID=A0A0K1ESD0_CHOCO|nr:alpha-E domain-containing protein [Chondromyces crocatus]AKT43840.1 uncharacterized protein CMC5_080770 [Chondromyces crocatus]
MISRVADHCFWFGRYLERAESTARVLAVTQHHVLDAELTPPEHWRPLLTASGQEPHFVEQFGAEAVGDGDAVQRYLCFDEDNTASMQRAIAAARDNARSIREVISLEVWETVNELHLWLDRGQGATDWTLNRHGFYRRIRQAVQLALGLTQSTMLHDTPLDFIWLGVLLERMGQTARILDVHHVAFTRAAQAAKADPTTLGATHQVIETARWLALLRACSGGEPFMKVNQGRVTGESVARFLAFEPRFPRSIRHCAHAAYTRLADIRPPESQALPGGDTLAQLHGLTLWIADKSQEHLDLSSLHGMLVRVVDETAAICDGIGRDLLGNVTRPTPSVPPPAAAPPQISAPARSTQSQS